MHYFADTPLKNLYTLKEIHTQTKMNAYKDFHAFNISVYLPQKAD